MGGSNDSSNIIILTIEEHALAHKTLWEQHGKLEDKLAWCMLLGKTDESELIRKQMASKRMKRQMSDPNFVSDIVSKAKATKIKRKAEGKIYKVWNKGIKDQRFVDSGKRSVALPNFHNIGDIMRNTSFTDEHKKLLSDKAKSRPKIICEHCQKPVIKQMYVRWHGNNCKYLGKK